MKIFAMTAALVAGVVLALPAQAQLIRYGNGTAVIPVTPTTPLPTTCISGCSGGSGGSLSAQANASQQTSTEGATTDPLSMDLNRNLRMRVEDGKFVTLGSMADSAYAGSGSASLIAIGKGLYALGAGAIPAGSNVIGGVTQSGSWSVNSTLQAGSALVGKVGIDQTTPGSTNGVQDAERPDAGVLHQRRKCPV